MGISSVSKYLMQQGHKGSRPCSLEQHALYVIFLRPPGAAASGEPAFTQARPALLNPRNLSRQRPSKQASGFSTHRPADRRLILRTIDEFKCAGFSTG